MAKVAKVLLLAFLGVPRAHGVGLASRFPAWNRRAVLFGTWKVSGAGAPAQVERVPRGGCCAGSRVHCPRTFTIGYPIFSADILSGRFVPFYWHTHCRRSGNYLLTACGKEYLSASPS